MSYDFSMYITAGTNHRIYTDLDINYTYNVSPMFYDSIQHIEGINCINGKTGEYSFPYLDDAFNTMLLNREKYQAMSPKNGWGNYTGALGVLYKLRRYAKIYPNAIFEVN